MKRPQLPKRCVGVSRRQLQLLVLPYRCGGAHDEIECSEIAVTSNLRIKQEQQVQAAPALLQRRFKSGKKRICLVPKRDPVVVIARVPLLHDPPYRADCRAGRNTRRVRRETKHPHLPLDRALQEAPRVGADGLLSIGRPFDSRR